MANNELQMPMAKKYKMPFKSITKRDGTLADFDSDKIYNAILREGENTAEFGGDDEWVLNGQVLKILSHKFDESLPSVEDIQDIVEEVLISNNYFKTAKAYILYRDKRNRMRGDGKTVVDVESSINEYANTQFTGKDATSSQGVDALGNCTYSSNFIKQLITYAYAEYAANK